MNNYPHPPFYLKSLTCLKNKKSINFKDQGTNWCPITELNFLIQSKCQVSSPNMPIPHQTRATLYIKQLNVMFCVASWHKVFWHGHNHHLALIKFRRGWKVPSLCKLCILMTYNFGCFNSLRFLKKWHSLPWKYKFYKCHMTKFLIEKKIFWGGKKITRKERNIEKMES